MRIPPSLTRDDTKDIVAWSVDVVSAFRELLTCPLLDGARLENVAVGTSSTQIAHKLGRTPTGFLVINKPGQADVWHERVPTKTQLYLQADVAITVDLWVF